MRFRGRHPNPFKSVSGIWTAWKRELLWAAPALAADDVYDFPFENPYLATILGTPTAQEFPLVKHIPVKLIDLTIFPERKYPDIFWYNDQLRCSVVAQKGKAPLIFVIALVGMSVLLRRTILGRSIYAVGGNPTASIGARAGALAEDLASHGGRLGRAEDFRGALREWNTSSEAIH